MKLRLLGFLSLAGALATLITIGCGAFGGVDTSPAGADGGDASLVDGSNGLERAAGSDGAATDAASKDGGQRLDASVTVLWNGGPAAGPTAIAVDGTGVYWVDHIAGDVRRYRDKDGVTRLVSDNKSPQSIALVGGAVIWGDFGHGTISWISENGAGSSPNVLNVPAAPRLLAAGGGTDKLAVMWTASDDSIQISEPPYSSASPFIAPANTDMNRWGIAVDAANYELYASASASGYIDEGSSVSASLPFTPIETGQTNCQSLAVGGGNVYWASPSTNPASGSLTALFQGNLLTVSSTESGPNALAADASGVYWLNVDNGELRYWKSGTMSPVTLATGNDETGAPMYFQGVALDDNYVYWVSYADGLVKRIAKP